jgi:hypothetical protein
MQTSADLSSNSEPSTLDLVQTWDSKEREQMTKQLIDEKRSDALLPLRTQWQFFVIAELVSPIQAVNSVQSFSGAQNLKDSRKFITAVARINSSLYQGY